MSQEFKIVDMPDEEVWGLQLDSGEIIILEERRLISDHEAEYIQHRNRDSTGRYYTTRHVYQIPEGHVIDRYRQAEDMDEYERGHLIRLRDSVEVEYAKLDRRYLGNLRKTCLHYIENHKDTKHKEALQALINTYHKIGGKGWDRPEEPDASNRPRLELQRDFDPSTYTGAKRPQGPPGCRQK